MAALRQGQIVWVEIRDSAGRNPKCRPAVVLTKTSEIHDGEPIVVVAATGRIDQPLPKHHVALPWMHSRHPVTGLYKPCVAVCDWLAEIEPSQVISVGGNVPTHIMMEIVRQATRHIEE